MIIAISRSGIVRLKKKKVKPVLKPDEPINTNEQELADNFKEMAISGEGFKKSKLQNIASEVLPTNQKLKKFIKFNI
jgi:hypothetical protein